MSKPRAFEAWMLSNIAAGAATMSFVVLLIPPFITRVTGSPIRAGIVLAMIGLAALAGPWIGRFADKHRAHRTIYLLSLFGMALAFVILALDSAASYYGPLAGLLLGLASAAQGTIGPAFIVGAGYPKQAVARKLTVYSLLFPVGQVAGAAAVAVGLLAGAGEELLFWVAAAFLGVLALLVWPSLGKPAARLQASSHLADRPAADPPKAKPHVLFSVFGLFLLIATFGAIANNGMYSQIANILPAVYGFSASQAAGLVGLAGLLSIGAIIFAGRMMARRGSYSVYQKGSIIKWVGMSGMAIVGVLGGAHLLLAALMVLIAYQGPQLTKLASPDVAATLAPVRAAEANGYYFATSALGAFLGSLAAGALAQFVSYNAINRMNALLGGIAVLLIILFLSHRVRNRLASG